MEDGIKEPAKQNERLTQAAAAAAADHAGLVQVEDKIKKLAKQNERLTQAAAAAAAAYRAGLIQVNHRGIAHEADGHAQPALHPSTVGAHFLVAHPTVEEVDTAQSSVHSLLQLQTLHTHTCIDAALAVHNHQCSM